MDDALRRIDGLGHVNVLTNMIFAGISGSALADAAGPSLAAITTYLLMVVVLFWKPQGLFPAGS